jgi:hypothetical protein
MPRILQAGGFVQSLRYVAVLAVLGSAPAPAQERLEASMVFPEFVRLSDSAERRAPAVSAQTSIVRGEFSKLSEALAKQPEGATPDYERIFAYYARELRAASEDVFDPTVGVRLNLLLQDMRIKNDFMSIGFGMANRGKNRVELRVSTLSGGRPVNGYAITGNPRGYAQSTLPFFSAGKLSSPATMSVLPGTYTIQARAGARVVTKDVTVGWTGSEFEDVEISVD